MRLHSDQSFNNDVLNSVKYLVIVDAHLRIFCSQLLKAPLRGVVGLIKVKFVKVSILVRYVIRCFLVHREVCQMHKTLGKS
jgi:hypothetical protein